MNSRSLLFVLCVSLFSCGSDPENAKSAAATPASPACTSGDSPQIRSLAATAAVSDRFIVKVKENSAFTRQAQTFRNLTAGSRVEPISTDQYLVSLPAASTAGAVAELLPNYDYIEPDYRVHTTLVPNDEKLSSQWAHAVVHSEAAWDISRGSSSVVVAILDSGIDYNHPDLAGNIWTNPDEIPGNGIDDDNDGYIDDVHGWNFVSDNNRPVADDKSFHGTHVAGTVGAVGNNGIGISGHAQEVKLMALKFLDDSSTGFTSNAIKGIDYAIKKKVKIINNSWGSSSKSQALSEAIDRARAAGILFVVAAGNNGSDNDKTGFYPANYPQDNVISVAASTISDQLASFSNYGIDKVDLAAPGVNIYSTKNGGSYQSLSGTSMATPLVSGVLATMVAARPDLSYAQIKGALLQSVDKISAYSGKVKTGGRINSERALQEVVSLPGDWQPPVIPSQRCPI